MRERAQAELDLLLGDLATWVDVDTPGGDLEALDGLGRVLALEAERYGLEPELVETPGGLALHAQLRGSGRGEGRAARPPRHRLRAGHGRRSRRSDGTRRAATGPASPT